MSYISDVVSQDERLIAVARVHWIHGVKGLVWLLGFVLLGGLFDTALILLIGDIGIFRPLIPAIMVAGTYIFWVCLPIGLFFFALYFLMMVFTEAGLTSERLIYKTGWLFVDVKEIDLEEVKAVEVDNGIFGSLLSYGTIVMDTRFIRDLTLPTLHDPYAFVMLINEARTEIKNDPLNIVVESKSGSARQAVAEKLAEPSPQPEPSPGEGGAEDPTSKPQPVSKMDEGEEASPAKGNPGLDVKVLAGFQPIPIDEDPHLRSALKEFQSSTRH